MNIIVTGGAGFIGQHLCESLLEIPKTRVVCVDNLSTGNRNAMLKLEQSFPKQFRFVEGDVTCTPLWDVLKVVDCFFDSRVDRIFHLACPASPVHYQVDPIKTLLTSVIGTKNMLDIATEYNARILFTSTSEIYGDPEVAVQNESYRGRVNCTGPRACYDEGKRAGETLCFDYNRTKGTDIRVVRIFNTYGPNMRADDGRVVSNFITQALQNNTPLTIYGDGLQTRSFCFVDDLVAGLLKMMDTPGILGPINLGNPNEITIKELAGTISEMVGSEYNIKNVLLPEDDPARRKPDITLAKQLLGWVPSVSLHTGLSKTIAYFAQLRK